MKIKTIDSIIEFTLIKTYEENGFIKSDVKLLDGSTETWFGSPAEWIVIS
jgi:hypothetical protein